MFFSALSAPPRMFFSADISALRGVLLYGYLRPSADVLLYGYLRPSADVLLYGYLRPSADVLLYGNPRTP
jgi:hypothetical protein